MPKSSIIFFAVRTTSGQEGNVADMIALRAKANNLPVKSVIAPEGVKGYIFLEAPGPHVVDAAITGVKHVRARVPGKLTFSDVEHYITVRPVIEELEVDAIVEVVGGPLKGSKARVTRVDKVKQEVTVELLDIDYTIPITVSADHVKLVSKEETE